MIKIMKKNGFETVLIVLVIILLGIVGYFVYKNYLINPQNLDVSSSTPSAVSSPISDWKTYTNTKYNYSIKYPSDWTFREFPDTQTGAGFRLVSDPNDFSHEYISVDFSQRAVDLRSLPFEAYVKKAAVEEIQNFLSLATITKVVTVTGVIGYKTTWNVQSMGAPIGGKTSVSDPITYFDTKDVNGDTIQVFGSANYLDIYNQMLATFTFIK